MAKKPNLTINTKDLRIQIEGPSEHFFGEDLQTNAIKALIEEADIHGWTKHNNEFHDMTARRLSAQVLLSLCLMVARELDLLQYQSMTPYEILDYIIQDLKENKTSLLDKPLTSNDLYDDED
ncbi:MAG: hypothetical protein RLZZ156_1408 [Deinococcota bacterium]|jgi:hypothetical protein